MIGTREPNNFTSNCEQNPWHGCVHLIETLVSLLNVVFWDPQAIYKDLFFPVRFLEPGRSFRVHFVLPEFGFFRIKKALHISALCSLWGRRTKWKNSFHLPAILRVLCQPQLLPLFFRFPQDWMRRHRCTHNSPWCSQMILLRFSRALIGAASGH